MSDATLNSCCAADVTAGVSTAQARWDWFTNYGNYMPRVECLRGADGRPDWPWIIEIIALTSCVIAGYLRIVVFWRKSYLAERGQDRNRKLMELAWIFVLCATCGYAMSILMFFWPAYRLLAIFLVGLNIVTWRFIATIGDFRASFQTHRLKRQLDEQEKNRNKELEALVAVRTAELEAARAEADRIAAEYRKLAKVAQLTSNAVVITDAHRRIVWANEGFTRITGYTIEEALGQSPGRLLQSPNTDPEVVARVREALNEGVRFRGEILNRAKNGREYWLDMSIEPLRDEAGVLTGFMAIESEISERKQVEEALRIAEQRAVVASTSKSEFLANMSHEIRTPMTAILGYADLLAEEPDQGPESRQRLEYIRTIRRNGEHLLAIINDILDLSKIEAGKLALERVECNPAQVVMDVLTLMQVKAQGKGLALNAAYSEKFPAMIRTDPVRLRQILVNLVGNAIKFTEMGSVTIGVEWDRARPERLTFEIRDTGIGLTPEQMSRLFGAFEQADASTSRRFGGTGLGLRISKRLAQMLGGDIEVSSELGRGSCFKLTIDAGAAGETALVDGAAVGPGAASGDAGAPVAAAASAEPSASLPLKGIRILLAEDGPDNQRLISFHLRRAGADTRVVENGQQAIQALTLDGTVGGPLWDPAPVDILLSDMQMPVMDGYEACKLLRQKGCRLPIVALTAHAMSGDADRCLDAGCDLYVSKPIDKTRLIEACLAAFEKARGARRETGESAAA